MTSMKIAQFSGPPLTSSSPSKTLPRLSPWTSDLPPPNDNNQLKEIIIQGWLLYVIRSFLQVGFRFQHQLTNLVCLSFDFFSFSWSLTIWFFVTLYSCVWSCLKISLNVFYLWLFTILASTHFAINLFLKHNLKM